MRLAIVLSVLVFVTSCSGDIGWQTRNISGIMPPLEFTLTGEDGSTVTQEAFRGEPVAVYFGYTHCPDICPLTLHKLQTAIARLPEDERSDLKVLFISVDPKRDDPATLAQYTSSFGPQFVGLTGDEDTLRSLAKRYRATFSYGEPDEHGDYMVSHPSAIYVFDAKGKIRLLMRTDDGADAIAHDLGRLVEATG